MRIVLLLVVLLTAASTYGAGYRLDLEVNPVGPFPFLNRFGQIELSIYPGGIRGEALFLKGFTRNGESTVRVANPISRMYADVPISQIRSTLLALSNSATEIMPGMAEFPISSEVLTGSISGIPAERHRVILGESWIDVWSTTAIPRNPQFDRLFATAIGTVSKSSENLLSRIPGTIIQVEMNTQRFKKFPLVRFKKLVMSNQGEAEALRTGSFYMKAPFVDFFLK